MTSTPELDDRIEYDETGASLVGVDDYRPYVVRDQGRVYRFPDLWQAREFAAIVTDPEA